MATVKTIDKVVATYKLIGDAKITKMDNAKKIAFIRVARSLKKITEDFDALVKDTQDRLRPDGFDTIVEKVQSETELTQEEQNTLDNYRKDVAVCIEGELTREVELDVQPLGEDALGQFLDSNDFKTVDALLISEIIG